jgi:hypothetical protein
MSNIFGKELPDPWSKSFLATELAIFHMIHTTLILTAALKKRDDTLFKFASQDLLEWLKTLAEMQKKLLKKLENYLHFLAPDDGRGFIQVLKNVEDRKESVEFYTSSIMEHCYGPSYVTEIGFRLSEMIQDLSKYYVQKNLLLQRKEKRQVAPDAVNDSDDKNKVL